MSDDERAIRELIDTWMAASRAGDTQTVLGLMTDDVVFMVPGREPFGKQEFAAMSQGMKDVRIEGRARSASCRCWATGPMCAAICRSRSRRRAATAVKRAGYTLTILRKQPDGRWLLARDANLLTPQT